MDREKPKAAGKSRASFFHGGPTDHFQLCTLRKKKMNYPAASRGRRSQGTEIMDAASLQFQANTIAWSRAARRRPKVSIVPF
jgi:hypothetical protein